MAKGKKVSKKAAVKEPVAETEELAPKKLKKDFDIIDPVEAVPLEKVAEDGEVLEDAEATDEESEEASLDDEELNPFKDKWEE